MRQHFLWAVCSCSVIIWAGTQSWAFQEDQTEAVGLSGLIASYAPDGLEPEDFEDLAEEIDETWKEWTLETGQFVQDFYEGENTTVEAQRAALKKLRVKLKTMEKSLNDSRYQSIHAQIGDLYAKLLPRVDMAEAALDTLTVDEEAALKKRTSSARSKLQSAVREFRSDMLNGVSNGRPWLEWAMISDLQKFSVADPESLAAVDAVKAKMEERESYGEEIQTFMSRESFLELEDALAAIQEATTPTDSTQLREDLATLFESVDEYYDEPTAELAQQLRSQFEKVRGSAPDGGKAIADAFATHFLNYNMRLTISQGFVNRLVGQVRNESSRINDSLGGARIVGNQFTTTNLSVDIVPSKTSARMNLTVDGTVRTNSLAYASQATVRTNGYHTFNATKPVTFDGNEFSTQPARISVRANNQPVGVNTRYSGGLFGRIADNIAMREAQSRIGQANAYTANGIRREVGGELNREVDTRFANASMELQNRLYGPLREYGLYPDAIQYSSTNSEILGWTRLADADEVGGNRPVPGADVPKNGLVAHIHESLLSNGTSRLDLGTGDKVQMSEGDLKNLLEERLSRILDREVKLGDEEEGDGEQSDGAIFVFDQEDPVRFMIDDGEVVITLRAGLNRGDEMIPTQIITVPLMPSVEGDRIVMKRGNVGVKPAERAPSVAEQIARANVMRSKIESTLPERDFKAEFDFEREGKVIKMKISELTADNGWLSLTIE